MLRIRSFPWHRLASALRRESDWLAVFVGSSLVVLLGVSFGRAFVPPGQHIRNVEAGPLVNGFVRWDGTYYRTIVEEGYERPAAGAQAPIHFMPVYPLLARGLRAVTGLSAPTALVLTAHACFLAALWLIGRYVEERHPTAGPNARTAALVAAGFTPAGMFFHCGYTESLFLLLCVLQLYLIHRGAHPLWVAAVVAVAVVTRPVGIALVLPSLLYSWRWGGGGWRSVAWTGLCAPVTLLGAAAFMLYCDYRFDDPILFVRGRDDLWRIRAVIPVVEKVEVLLSLEPVWDVFTPGSPAYWRRYCASPAHALFSIYPANPVYFLVALVLGGWGIWQGLLNRYEGAVVAGLLAIPYWVNGYDQNMMSLARYTTVIVPLYAVAGVSLCRVGPTGLAALAACGGVFMTGYAGLFAQGYFIL